MAIGNLEVIPDKNTVKNYAQKWTVLQFLIDSCSPHYLDFGVE
jgi:hypothetical protein